MTQLLVVLTVCAIVAVPLVGWVLLIMWLSALSDRKYRERERLQQVFKGADR